MEALMIALSLQSVKRILFLGAHSDDIEIGCGGFLLQQGQAIQERGIAIDWAVFSGKGTVREAEARAGQEAFLPASATQSFNIYDLPDGNFPSCREHTREILSTLAAQKPDLIFTHHYDDRHQDHRFLAEMTYNAFRNHLILEYEIIKYDGDLGNPNLLLEVSQSNILEKARLLNQVFGSQRSKNWFTEDTFTSLARLRGVQLQTTFAEGYYCRKAKLQL